ncbi:MAG: phage tail tube protein [Geopsychrobacter sp.]|nr:phage tail tube protein [Geopsychrobacter sp.]
MSAVAGTELKFGLKKAATWGTPVACSASDGLLLLPTGIKRDAGVDTDDSLGQFWAKDGTPGAVKVEGDIPSYLRYDGMDLLLALFMGIAGAPVQQAATAAYAYTYDLADNTDGLFATFAKHMKTYVSEVPSLKIAGLTLKGEQGKPLQLIANCIGDNMVEDGTNTTITFNNVTIAEVANRIQFAQGVFRLNDQGAIALAAGDKIGPSSFEMTAKRKLTGTYGSFVTGGANSQDLIDEPVNDGAPEVTLKLQFPKHTGKTRLTELGADTRKKMDITFTGGLIASTYYREFKLELPHLQLKSVDVVDETGIIKEPVEFLVHAATAAPAGMTLTKPFRLSGINTRTTDPLA